MKRFTTGAIGVTQGSNVVFSDFSDGGEMWSGDGDRVRRKFVEFDEPFRTSPMVHVGISLWDVNRQSNFRADISAENVSRTGFDLVFRTWGDSQIARISMNWIAFGELGYSDDWDVR